VNTASIEFCLKLLTRLRSMVRMPKDMAGADLDLQMADYARVLSKYAPQDVEAGILRWAESHKFWPTLNELLRSVGEAGAGRLSAIAQRGKGENFVQRALRLGFHAGRLSEIGYQQWQHIANRPLDDVEVVQALSWCEANPGRTWGTEKAPATADEIRTTAKLVFDIDATPESFIAGRALAKIGRELIRRHMEAGTCPPDVATFFAPLPPEPPS
jgi:hypothetical protein